MTRFAQSTNLIPRKVVNNTPLRAADSSMLRIKIPNVAVGSIVRSLRISPNRGGGSGVFCTGLAVAVRVTCLWVRASVGEGVSA